MRFTAWTKNADLLLESITDTRKVGKCIGDFTINFLWDLVSPGIQIASNLFLILSFDIYEDEFHASLLNALYNWASKKSHTKSKTRVHCSQSINSSQVGRSKLLNFTLINETPAIGPLGSSNSKVYRVTTAKYAKLNTRLINDLLFSHTTAAGAERYQIINLSAWRLTRSFCTL